MKKLTKILTCVMCAMLVVPFTLAFAACGGKTNDGKTNDNKVTVSGSSSVTPIMEKLAAEYEKTHDVRITVNMSSSGAGISDTLSGLNDFGMSSRALKESETGVVGETLCMDGIALIVSNENNVNDVKKEDVKALFEQGIAIPGTAITAAIGRDASSGTRSAFDELLGIKNGYHKSVATLAETGNVIEAIKNSSVSIGYISYGSLGSSVKAVSLDGVACTVENIKNNTYALQRPFVIVCKESTELSEAAKGFYDYIMSEDAQTIIAGAGYISVK